MTVEIPLTRGMVALVDDSDADDLLAAGPWHASGGKRGVWYAKRHVRRPIRQAVMMHGLILGCSPVDHINGDGLDNRRSNLRPATIQQNNWNLGRPGHNTSGFKGVSLYRRTGRWRAYIKLNDHSIHLGYYVDAIEAARAYDAAASEMFGKYARLNFPTPLKETP